MPKPTGSHTDPDRAIVLALAALYAKIDDLDAGPGKPTLEMRALLALLHARSNGDREPFDQFWATYLKTWPNAYSETEALYLRGTHARTAWYGVARAVGVEPRDRDFLDAVMRLAMIDPGRAATTGHQKADVTAHSAKP